MFLFRYSVSCCMQNLICLDTALFWWRSHRYNSIACSSSKRSSKRGGCATNALLEFWIIWSTQGVFYELLWYYNPWRTFFFNFESIWIIFRHFKVLKLCGLLRLLLHTTWHFLPNISANQMCFRYLGDQENCWGSKRAEYLRFDYWFWRFRFLYIM